MQIHELSLKKRKAKKCIGRGGKRGTYSGRGMKGQKARSGGNVDPLFEGGRTTLLDKMKKLRGFKSPHAKANVLTLQKIDTYYTDGEIVSLETLIAKGIVRHKNANKGVKVVVRGAITKKVTIAGDVKISATAKEMIEKAGGKVETEVVAAKTV